MISHALLRRVVLKKKELIKVTFMSLDKTIERRHVGVGNGSVKPKAQGFWKVAFTFASEFNSI